MSYKILGVSGSLRNARRGLGNVDLINDIMGCATEEELKSYLQQEAAKHLDNFMEAGRKDKIPFDQMYTNLKKLKGNKGLSNSEVALTAALWSAKEIGAEIDHLSLAEYFTEAGDKNIEELKAKLIEADGILLSSPVYFGDRGSLSQSFIELIRNDNELKAKMKNKLYAGCAVGAKRNGGQETCLIYQLLDMINTDMLGVGNDSETTSQYGGTGLAGDIGTMPKDDYGLATAMGTGRRIARVTGMMKMAEHKKLVGKHKVVFWILQDKDKKALNYVRNLVAPYGDQMEATILDISEKTVIRCLACDICPTNVGVDEVYRCIIKSKKDDFEDMHPYFLDADAVIPVAYSPKDRTGLISNYQRFIERTRYIRRGDYVMSDIVTAPFVIEDLGANENLHIRMMTSMIRHHTLLAKPLIAYMKNEQMLNEAEVKEQFEDLNNTIREVAKGRLTAYSANVNHLKYKPVGYVLSAAKDKEDEKLLKRAEMIEDRVKRNKNMAAERVVEASQEELQKV